MSLTTLIEPAISLTPAPSAMPRHTGNRARLLHTHTVSGAALLVEQHAHGHLHQLARTHRGGSHKPTRMLNSMLDLATRLTVVAGPARQDDTRDDTPVLRLGALWTSARTPASPKLLDRAVREIDATTLDAIVGWSYATTPSEHRDVERRLKTSVECLTGTLESLAPEHGIDLTRATLRYITAHRAAA